MKKRILSAIIMIAIFVPILVVGGKYFAVLMTALAVLGLYELLKVRETKKEFPAIVKLFAYIVVLFFTFSSGTSISFEFNLDYRVVSCF